MKNKEAEVVQDVSEIDNCNIDIAKLDMLAYLIKLYEKSEITRPEIMREIDKKVLEIVKRM